MTRQPAIDQAHENLQAHNSANRGNEHSQPGSEHARHGGVEKVSRSELVWTTVLSFLVFALGLAIAAAFSGVWAAQMLAHRPIDTNAPNKGLHRTAIPPRFIAAGELGE